MVHDEALLETRRLVLERARMRLLACTRLAGPDGVQLVREGAVCRLWHDTLLVEEAEHADCRTARFDEVDGRLKVEAEVYIVPFDTFPRVLLLFENEHMVIEELLELLVCVVDEQLLVPIDVKNLEAGDIEYTNES